MTVEMRHPVLAGRRALVVGIANEHSIAYGCAKAFRHAGAELAITYLNEKARPFVEPLSTDLGASILLSFDVSVPGKLEAVFEAIATQWGRLDILVHSIAFAPKEDLRGGLLDCSAEGFAKAMDISCHSFVRMAKLGAPLMTKGGTMFAIATSAPTAWCRTTMSWGRSTQRSRPHADTWPMNSALGTFASIRYSPGHCRRGRPQV